MAAASASHAAIQKKIYGSGMTALIISSEERKISRKWLNILQNQCFCKRIRFFHAKELKAEFTALILSALAAALLGNVLVGKRVI